ncbi:MAG: 5'-3' exonuclease H3TH domain-containing protein [Romboutsia sp.]
MDNLFDFLEYKIKKDSQENLSCDLIIDENHLLHLEKVRETLYNEYDIKSSGLNRSDYIRLNSYVGSSMNTDLTNPHKDIKDNYKVEDIAKDDNPIVDKIISSKLLIVDGSSLLSTSFYATARDLLFAKTDEQKEFAYTKLMQTPDGIYTNGIYIFFKTLIPLIKKQNITHLAIVLDKSRNTFRREIYPEYKGTRKETPHPLSSQFKLLTEILSEVNIAIFSDDRYEADDFAGSLVKKFETTIPIFLHTKDEDYIQLVSDYTKLWMVTSKYDTMYNELGVNLKDLNIPSGVFEYTPKYVNYFKGIDPIQIIDAKAIEGDKSDNIKGVKNVGETSSRPLLRYYKTIEGIYEALENLDAKDEKDIALFFKEELGIKRSPIKNLLTYKEDAFISKQLATIKTDIKEIQDIDLDKLELDINYDKMTDIFKKLNIKYNY